MAHSAFTGVFIHRSALTDGVDPDYVCANDSAGCVAIDTHFGEDTQITFDDMGEAGFVTIDIKSPRRRGWTYLYFRPENIEQAIALRDAADAAIVKLTQLAQERKED